MLLYTYRQIHAATLPLWAEMKVSKMITESLHSYSGWHGKYRNNYVYFKINMDLFCYAWAG